MKEFTDNIDEIEAYLDGKLNAAETSAFENRISNESDLEEQIQQVKDLRKGIHLASEKRIRKNLDSVESKLNNEAFFVNKSKEIKMTNSKRFNWIPLAASMALVVAAALFFLKPSNGPNMEELYAEYYKPDSEVVKEVLDRMEARGLATENNEDEKRLKAALEAYSKYDYNSARTQLSSYLDEFPEDQTGRFYMGLTQLNMGNYALSTEYLQPLCTEEGFPYKDQAKWYLALGCTQISGPDGLVLAKKYFKQLAADKTSVYQANAKAYLSHLEDI